MKILVLNGPNLNLLGTREVDLYGQSSLEHINEGLVTFGREHGLTVECRQSNIEGTLVDWIHEAVEKFDGLVINPGGYTHTSAALRDALLAFPGKVIEVHLTNTAGREPFRRDSLTAATAWGVISGLGGLGYKLALTALSEGASGDD